ncbi:hypothetical protein DXG01_014499 [Tephrocybe rancida]|nr:hypothetical protein DXG01_014499 [Tephrocybe rancida]
MSRFKSCILDDPKEKERSGEVAANVEVDKHLECIASMSAASPGIAPAMAPAAEASTETMPTSPHTLGADPVPSASSLPIAGDTIAGQASSSEGARAAEVFLGGGPILPGIAMGTSVPLTTGDAILVPTISVINPTLENLQEQVPVAGPLTRRSLPRNHTGSEDSEVSMYPHYDVGSKFHKPTLQCRPHSVEALKKS